MAPCPQAPDEYVSATIIRQLFNEGKFWERALQGEFCMIIRRDSVCRRPPEGEPQGLRSQIVYYVDHDGETVAVVHQYLRPDGSLGGSGKPDPKHLRLGTRRLHLRRLSGDEKQ